MEETIPLRFRNDGTFKILHVTDVQENPNFSPDTLHLLTAALDRETPDLVVFTGDQIKGYSARFRGKSAKAAFEKAVCTLLLPLEARCVPFCVTFGNHDQPSVSPRYQRAGSGQLLSSHLQWGWKGCKIRPVSVRFRRQCEKRRLRCAGSRYSRLVPPGARRLEGGSRRTSPLHGVPAHSAAGNLRRARTHGKARA